MRQAPSPPPPASSTESFQDARCGPQARGRRHTATQRRHGLLTGGEGAPTREPPLPAPDCLGAPPFTPENDTNQFPLGNLPPQAPPSGTRRVDKQPGLKTETRLAGPDFSDAVSTARVRPRAVRGILSGFRRPTGTGAPSTPPGPGEGGPGPGREGSAEDRRLLSVSSAPLPPPPTASSVSHVAPQPLFVDTRPSWESPSVSVPPRHGHP